MELYNGLIATAEHLLLVQLAKHLHQLLLAIMPHGYGMACVTTPLIALKFYWMESMSHSL